MDSSKSPGCKGKNKKPIEKFIKLYIVNLKNQKKSYNNIIKE